MKEMFVTDAPILPDSSDAAGVVVLVVRPHPDDESSATGGMLARYATRGP